MDCQTDKVIQDTRGEARWKVARRLFSLPRLNVWEVSDQVKEMERTLYLMTLDYAGLPLRDRDFDIRTLRDSFLRMVTILSQGTYNFLPEPVDLLTFVNHWDPMDAELRPDEPGLVFAKPAGTGLRPVHDRSGEVNIDLFRKAVIHALGILKPLHDQQVVIQELPRAHIIFNPVTYQYYFMGIPTLMRMDDFRGYNTNRVMLSPDPVFSAPEVRDPKGRLTPATDIYALGKFALQLALGDAYEKTFTSHNPFPADTQRIINALKLPSPWPRFLSMCLQLDPTQRFQNVTEAKQFLRPEEQRTARAKDPASHPGQGFRTRSGLGAIGLDGATATPPDPAATVQKGPWAYRDNPQLPSAMLLIWGERLTTRDQQFNFLALYRDLMYHYHLTPRLFFQTYRKSSPANNPFFEMLEKQFKMRVTPLDGNQDPIGVLNHALDPYLADIHNLILVGGADEAGVQCVLQHPNASSWRIHWIRGAGNWNPRATIETVVDITKYLRVKQAHNP